MNNVWFKHSITLFLFFIGFVPTSGAQAAFNVKAGVETWSFKDEKESFGQSRHPGQMIGFDVFVEKNKLMFIPGFHYHRISILNEEKVFSIDFSDAHHIHYFNIPITFGYKVLDVTGLEMVLAAGAEPQFYYDLDENDVGLDDDKIFGVSTSLTGLLHLKLFSFLTTEFRYHYGLQPLIKNRDESKVRGLTLAVGVKI